VPQPHYVLCDGVQRANSILVWPTGNTPVTCAVGLHGASSLSVTVFFATAVWPGPKLSSGGTRHRLGPEQASPQLQAVQGLAHQVGIDKLFGDDKACHDRLGPELDGSRRKRDGAQVLP
jgi:hypothetical protein